MGVKTTFTRRGQVPVQRLNREVEEDGGTGMKQYYMFVFCFDTVLSGSGCPIKRLPSFFFYFFCFSDACVCVCVCEMQLNADFKH